MTDFAAQYNTALSPQDEALFQAWAVRTGRQRDTEDYDLRGAWKDDAKAAMNGHLPDTYKKPNHPTFSTESMYNGKDGAVGGAWVDKGHDKWEFHASPYNLKTHGAPLLQEYFKHVEPGVALVLPK